MQAPLGSPGPRVCPRTPACRSRNRGSETCYLRDEEQLLVRVVPCVSTRIMRRRRHPPTRQVLHSVRLTLQLGGMTGGTAVVCRSEEHTSELQSLMRISYAVFCLKIKQLTTNITYSQ